MDGYCSNLEDEELYYILEGVGTKYRRNSKLIDFKKGKELLKKYYKKITKYKQP
ncbi:MAG: hypothetical protein K2J20_05685 [Bacilli bacterium]|nr:hypothetical protein [Bacilli bacterium]